MPEGKIRVPCPARQTTEVAESIEVLQSPKTWHISRLWEASESEHKLEIRN